MAAALPLCSRCRKEPRTKYSQWGKRCLAKYATARYRRRTPEQRKQARERWLRWYKANKEVYRAKVNRWRRLKRKHDPRHRQKLLRQSRADYRKNYDKIIAYARKYYLRKRFGLTTADYDAMLRKQKGRCGICGGQQKNGGRLAIDHCHETGKVRGLLCHRCNQGIGRFYDDPELLTAAARYLRSFSTLRRVERPRQRSA